MKRTTRHVLPVTLAILLGSMLALPGVWGQPSGPFVFPQPVIFNGGTSSGIGSTSLTVNGPATLAGTTTVPSGGTFTINGTVNGTNAPITASSTGLTFTGSNTYSGSTTFTGNVTFGGGKPWIDVTAPPYSAACNGSTDDTTALQAVLTALKTAGGGTFYVPPLATCLYSHLNATAMSHVTLQGQNWSSVLQCTATSGNCVDFTGSTTLAIQDMAFTATGATPQVGWLMAIPATGNRPVDIYIRHVKISGAYSGATIGLFGVYRFYADNLSAWNSYNNGSGGGDAAVGVLQINAGNAQGWTSAYDTLPSSGTYGDNGITLVNSDLHDVASTGAAYSNEIALNCVTCHQFTMLGGQIEGSATNAIVRLAANMDGAVFKGVWLQNPTGGHQPNAYFQIGEGENWNIDLDQVSWGQAANAQILVDGSYNCSVLCQGGIEGFRIEPDDTGITSSVPLIAISGGLSYCNSGSYAEPWYTNGIIIADGLSIATCGLMPNMQILSPGAIQAPGGVVPGGPIAGVETGTSASIAAGGSVTVTFPNAFSVSPVCTVSPNAASSISASVTVSSVSTTQLVIQNQNGAQAYTANWICVHP